MNRFEGIGRLTRDPRISYSQSETAMMIARYTLAIDRKVRQRREGQQTADFIPCVAFGHAAEFAEKYLRQGTKIAVTGHFQSGEYTNKDEEKVYTLELVVDDHYFCESRRVESGAAPDYVESAPDNDDFMNIPDELDENLPFN